MYSFRPTNHCPATQRQIEPILMRLTKEIAWRYRLRVKRFEPVLFEPVRCTQPMLYGTNRSPRDRMRHQVQLGEGAPGWRGRMPTDRYHVISP